MKKFLFHILFICWESLFASGQTFVQICHDGIFPTGLHKQAMDLRFFQEIMNHKISKQTYFDFLRSEQAFYQALEDRINTIPALEWVDRRVFKAKRLSDDVDFFEIHFPGLKVTPISRFKATSKLIEEINQCPEAEVLVLYYASYVGLVSGNVIFSGFKKIIKKWLPHMPEDQLSQGLNFYSFDTDPNNPFGSLPTAKVLRNTLNEHVEVDNLNKLAFYNRAKNYFSMVLDHYDDLYSLGFSCWGLGDLCRWGKKYD